MEEKLKRDYIYLRQGDVICSSEPDVTGWKYAFILTADCDLWNNKFGKYLTIIPVINVEEYIEEVFAKDQCRNELEKLFAKFSDIPGFSIDEDFFFSHILSASSEFIEEKYSKFGSVLIFSIMQKYINEEISAVKAIEEICEVRKAKWDAKIRQSLTTMKMEHFLNELPNAPGLGFVAMLRLPQSFSVDAVALSRDRMPENIQRFSAYKLGSLPDNIRYAVAQSFSNVYSRIGLNTSFERDREQIISMICESYAVGG
jgi:hypothetical protein